MTVIQTAAQINAPQLGIGQPSTATSAPSARRIYVGQKFVVGWCRDFKPIVNVPPGRHRLQLRNDSLATLFVRTTDGIRKFHLRDDGETWFAIEQAANLRVAINHQLSTINRS